MIYFPELRSALFRLVKAQTKFFQSDLSRHAQIVQQSGWSINPEGVFVRDRKVATWNSISLVASLCLPEWDETTSVVDRTPELKRAFATMMRTGSLAQLITIEQVVRQLLPNPVLARDGHTVSVASMAAFYDAYRSIDKYLGEAEFTVESVWPIANMSLAGSRTSLDRNLCLRRLRPKEFIGALNSQLIDPGNMRSGIHPKDAVCFGLVLRTQMSKEVASMSRESKSDHDLKIEIQERMLAACAVLGLERTALPGYVEVNEPFGGVRFTYAPWSFRQVIPWVQASSPLAGGQVKDLLITWRMLSKLKGPLRLCAMRLAYAQARSSAVDQMLDLVIAAEALYLSSDLNHDRGELSYRASLRAAIWAEPRQLHLSRREVFGIIRESYNVRSKIAHGSEAKVGNLKLKGEQVEMHRLIELLRLIVRMGLRKAMRQADKHPSGKFEPGWEDRMLR
jgi:hypothetical protein